MKIPQSSKLRFYSALLSLIFIVGGALLLLYTSITIQSLDRILRESPEIRKNTGLFLSFTEMSATYKHINLGTAIAAGSGFLISFLIFISSFRSRLSRYRRIIERLEITNPGPLNLAGISFPDEDEFGNLGRRLNDLIRKLDTFDRMKTDRIRGSMAVIRELGRLTDEPVAVVNSSYGFTYANEAFNSVFGIKEFRENMKLNAVFRSETLEDTIGNMLVKQSPGVNTDMEIDLAEQVCKCRLTGIPILNSAYQVTEIFFIFHNPKLSKKK